MVLTCVICGQAIRSANNPHTHEREILLEAVAIIRQWHGMDMPAEVEKRTWDIYYRSSPEMRRIREALER